MLESAPRWGRYEEENLERKPTAKKATTIPEKPQPARPQASLAPFSMRALDLEAAAEKFPHRSAATHTHGTVGPDFRRAGQR
jgi:hypothetical protein